MTTNGHEDEVLRSPVLQNATSMLAARQRAEQRSEFYLTEAQRLAHMGSWSFNPSGFFDYWSPELFRISGLDPAKGAPTLGDFLATVHPMDRESMAKTIATMVATPTGCDVKQRLVRSDGEIRHIRCVGVPMSDEGLGRSFVGTIIDVTEQEHLTQEIQRREMYLGEAQRLSHTGSFRWSMSTRALLWSEETFRIFELDSATTPNPDLVLQRVHPEDVHLVEQVIERATESGKDFDIEHRLVMPDGAVKHLHVVAHALSDGSGHIELVGALRDITEQRQSALQLAGEKRLLEMIAKGDSRTDVLDASCRLLETLVKGSRASILLFDQSGTHLRHAAAPSLPMAYIGAIDGLEIGPRAGSCGTAAHRGEPVIVSDTASDPLWADYRELARTYELGACWSIPILSSEGRVLGTFATYSREPRSPTPRERTVIEQLTHLASIAVERKRAEEVLNEQANLLDLTHDTVFVRDMSDVIMYWNRGAEELYGWTRQEALHQRSHDLMHTQFPAPLADINTELLGTDRWEGELVHAKRDGTRVVVASRWSVQRDERGHPIAILETNNDITERKRAEAELRASEEQWRDVFENNPTMYFMVNAAWVVQSVNPFGAEQLGYAVAELVGQSVLKVFHPADREAVVRNVTACFEDVGRSRSWEARKLRRDGAVISVRETAKAVQRVSGPIALIACEDITERRRAEAALRQAQTDLAHVSRMTTMGELTASLAHEVNQPIAASVTNARTCLRWLAADTPNIEKARAAAMRIVDDGTRAAEIISRTRRLFTKGTPQWEPVDINELIREMIVLLRDEIVRYAVSVRAQLADDVPQVPGDRVQLQQVLMNLIVNGIEAMKEVQGTRELTIKSWRSYDERLVVSVSDTGVGLPAQHAEHIFNAFFTTKANGTGLGLSISRSILEAHGGSLRAAANAPRGATFQVTLPVRVEAHE